MGVEIKAASLLTQAIRKLRILDFPAYLLNREETLIVDFRGKQASKRCPLRLVTILPFLDHPHFLNVFREAILVERT